MSNDRRKTINIADCKAQLALIDEQLAALHQAGVHMQKSGLANEHPSAEQLINVGGLLAQVSMNIHTDVTSLLQSIMDSILDVVAISDDQNLLSDFWPPNKEDKS